MSELKKVNIFPGRFQPFHLGHLKACEDAYKENKLPVYIMYIHNEKFDSKKPFDDELTKKELERLVDKYDYIEGINWLRRPMPMTICRVCIENGYQPVLWIAGEDRIDGYKSLMKGKSIQDELGIPEPEFFISKRYGSATTVREAIKSDNEEEFKKLMPKEAHSLYSEFKEQLSNIKESKIVEYISNKSIKGIDSYITEKLHLDKDIKVKNSEPFSYICSIFNDDTKYSEAKEVIKSWIDKNEIKNVVGLVWPKNKKYFSKYFNNLISNSMIFSYALGQVSEHKDKEIYYKDDNISISASNEYLYICFIDTRSNHDIVFHKKDA